MILYVGTFCLPKCEGKSQLLKLIWMTTGRIRSNRRSLAPIMFHLQDMETCVEWEWNKLERRHFIISNEITHTTHPYEIEQDNPSSTVPTFRAGNTRVGRDKMGVFCYPFHTQPSLSRIVHVNGNLGNAGGERRYKNTLRDRLKQRVNHFDLQGLILLKLD